MFFHKRLIPREEEKTIVEAIKLAEKQTSGEIRVHIESECKEKSPIARAIFIFDAIGMHQTKLRNGVLIYVALKSKKFAIIGDSGINAVIPDNFWNSTRDSLKEHFKIGKITEGIKEAILSTGEILKKEFPYQSDDINEQSDEISYGK